MNIEDKIKKAYANQGGNFDGIRNESLQKAIMGMGRELLTSKEVALDPENLYVASSYHERKISDIRNAAVKALELSIGYFMPMKFSICCSGRDCGCLGMPTEEEYYIMKNQEKALIEIRDVL